MADTLDPGNVRAVFRAYDVRGLVPDQVDEALARASGAAFVRSRGGDGRRRPRHAPSFAGMAGAFAEGEAGGVPTW